MTVDGTTLLCRTDTAEAADAVWVDRRRWLRIWSASRIRVIWNCGDTGAQEEMVCEL